MITYDGNESNATMIITLRKEPVKNDNGVHVDDQLRVVIDTEGSRYDRGIDFADGYPEAAVEVLEIVLGRIAQFDWEAVLRKMYS